MFLWVFAPLFWVENALVYSLKKRYSHAAVPFLFYIHQIFFHVLGLNRISTGRISSLPSSMVKIRRILEKAL